MALFLGSEVCNDSKIKKTDFQTNCGENASLNMELMWVGVGLVALAFVIVVVLMIIGKWANDKHKKELEARKQLNEPIKIVVHSSKMSKVLSKYLKGPSKKYGTGVMVSGNGPSLDELIRTKKNKIKNEEAAEKRKLVKQASSCGRTQSFAEEIQVARSVILGDEDKNLSYRIDKECGRSLSFLWTEPSEFDLATIVKIEEARSGVPNNLIQPNYPRAYHGGTTGSRSSDKTQPEFNMPENAARANECQTTVPGTSRKRSSEFVFAQAAVIVGGTTRKAQLRKSSEAGKVVKELSGRRGSTFGDDLKMARSVILHEGENLSDQHKGAEHRKVIKEVTSNHDHGRNSLMDDIQFAKSVILPDENTQSKDENARQNRRLIHTGQQAPTGRRRSSMLDDIRFARSVIMPDHKATDRAIVTTTVIPSDVKAEYISEQIRQARSNKRRRSSVISGF